MAMEAGTGSTGSTAPTGPSRRTTRRCTTTMSSSGALPPPWRACRMAGRLRRAVVAGLGDARTRILGVFLIVVAVLGTVVLRSFANFETVFVAALLAGSLLGRWWTILVPVAALAVLQSLDWTTYGGYGLQAMIGLSFFIISGYVFVGIFGRRIRPRILLRVKPVALLTTISVQMTIAYDLWTASGECDFITRPLSLTCDLMLKGHVP